jgi:hypothetical protein
MKQFINIITIMILIAPFSYGQKFSTDSLFMEFKKDIEIEQQEHNGRVVWDNETRLTYYLLMQTAPIDSLIKYTNDSNPAVRSEIFTGLARKDIDEEILNKIIDKHISDTAKFTLMPTDISSTWIVIDYMKLILQWKLNKELRIVDYNKELEKLKNDFYIIIPGADHGLISKDELMKVDRLTCSNDGCKIISFTLHVGDKSAKSNNNALTKKMKRFISKANHNDMVCFEDLRIERPDKSFRIFNPIMIKIK